MFFGALLGAFFVLDVSPVGAVALALALLCTIAVITAWLSRSDPSWVRPSG
jgi:hypothetical protein